ncbi:MAG: hypothetical protein HY696_05315 [Deltaproteobacteria bacterium]|nr:hypothetical protein [Deltaproteobacteria bacterium]
MRRLGVILALTFGLCGGGCGDGEQPTFAFDEAVPLQLEPYIARITPTVARAGDTVTIIGFGYSAIPNDNVVVMDDVAVAADTYGVAAAPAGTELEQLTFQVPSTLTVGSHVIGVIVYDNISNTEQTLTVTP